MTNPSDSHHAYTHSSGVTLFKGDIVLIKAWNAHSEAIKALCRVDERMFHISDVIHPISPITTITIVFIIHCDLHLPPGLLTA